jgi:signal transduction histidine kinase/CheY-like chemotaxis protein/HAMP domain-containing protein
MKIRDLKIGSQFLLGFSIILFLVILLGINSYFQTRRMHEQTQILYHHTLQVRRSVGVLNTNIQIMRLGVRDLLLASNDEEKKKAIQSIELSSIEAKRQFDNLFKQYTGSIEHIEAAYQAFNTWNTAREKNIILSIQDDRESVKASVLITGDVGKLREIMLQKIKEIDDFSIEKGNRIFSRSENLKNHLNTQLIGLIFIILLFTISVYLILLRNIRKPLVMLTNITRRFDDGDMSARSTFKSENEIGQLSNSFNTLAENIQITSDLNIKTALLADMMLIEDDVKEFFRVTLQILMDDTESEMAAVYLLSADKKHFEHFLSIGLAERARKSFSAIHMEGEFGNVIATKRIQHIKNIPEETRYIFKTTSGNVIPKEIITIPILSGNEIIAIISFANIHTYSDQAVQLIKKIHLTYCARVDKILAYEKIKLFSESLSAQNHELEEQKRELSLQSAELTEQNRELEIQKKMLHEANTLKTNFLSNMSHELRTPLNSVIALSGVLNRKLADKIPAEEYSYLEVIERNGKNLLGLINNILDIARIESGREEIELIEFNLCECVNEMIELIVPQTNGKKVRINKATGDCKTRITSDVSKIKHILQNLLGNAVKFTEDGEISVQLTKTIDEVSVTVTDTGIGIHADQLSHIFEEFRQADGSTSRKFGGTGLGLSIARKYANMLGGSITVESKPEVGSSFTLTLPLYYAGDNGDILAAVENNIHDAISTKPENEHFANHSATILIIEDNEPAVIQIKDFLEESGYMVIVARDGEEGLETMNHITPDGIILDLMMPGIDGFKVLQTIRSDERSIHIPALILTAKHITKDELKFLKQNHIYQLIQKGDVKRDDLLKIVSGMVSKTANLSDITDVKEATDSIELKKTNETSEKPLILIVEDNPDNMIAVKALLSEKYHLIEAYNASDGLEMAKNHIPNLVLMDISLPGTDGVEAFKLMRKNPSLQHIPVVALTASALLEDKETILAHGFDDFIAKPIEEKVFFETINKFVYA